jgi:hypothetical protein
MQVLWAVLSPRCGRRIRNPPAVLPVFAGSSREAGILFLGLAFWEEAFPTLVQPLRGARQAR